MDTKKALMKLLGDRLREARKAKHLTHEELAKKANSNYNYISEIERGLKLPTLEKLINLTTALEISLSELFVGFEEILEDSSDRPNE
ncbi:helix-turn-helix domain-containing protein [Aquibacillus rhizosphaerae]|uniref:Helix-turn-helix transcriptional regulator n=1 Tax=Aquibacillus rhizosphaerae TaxID=3051431 RepID=A0ABT7L9D5_9BACI|nr:helix-turn-helix transcriptional regulator [Aquibacillus sp. LR5S19]MDL4842477.1 helix-turn-helix transcriptional regulator [Aquibacillus sp. LR5S19]